MNKSTKIIGTILTIGIIVTLIGCNGNIESGVINSHAYVDLGLPSGNLWATCNVGAGFPEDYGGYYILGQDIKKYLYAYYKDGDVDKYYRCNELNNLVELSGVVEKVDWDSGWHIPSKEDFEELMANCSCDWVKQNGVNGCLFIGSNGNRLFFPCAGRCYDGKLISVDDMNYYRLSPLSSPYEAWITDADLGGGGFGAGGFYDCGLSVRPICFSR